VDFIWHGEPRDLTMSLQCGQQAVQQAVDNNDARGVSISVKNKAGCSSLHCFTFTVSAVDVLLSVGSQMEEAYFSIGQIKSL